MSALFIIITAILAGLLIAIVAVGLKKVNDDLNKKVALKFTKERILTTSEDIENLKKQMTSLLELQAHFEKILHQQAMDYMSLTGYDTRLRAYTREGNIHSIRPFDVNLHKKSTLTQKKDLQTWP